MNLIVICLDTFRADLVGDGEKLSHVRTPNLDAFARDAVVFDRAFGEGQPTLQIRRAFFTGCRSFPWRYNFDRRGHWHHAAGWHKIPPEQDTLAEILLHRGYMTGLVADTYHMFKPTMNYTRGFATYEFIRGQESDNWRAGRLRDIEAQARRHVREPIQWARHSTLTQYLFNMRGRQKEEDYLCGRVFTTAMQWLEDNAENRPFLLWVDSFDPHEPWDPPTAYADEYCPGYDGKDFILPGAMHEQGPPTEEELKRTQALYFGEVTFVDKWVGRLLEKVDTLGITDDTVVMITCDHGTEMLDHGGLGKGGGNMRAYNTRILWYVRHPAGPRGKHVTAFVQSHDLMPTALHLLGVPCSLPGRNAWPLVTGDVDRLRDHIVIGWAGWAQGRADGHASVRDDRWSYSTPVGTGSGEETLCDLSRDPWEDQNVAAEHPDVVAMHRERIEAVIQQPLPGVFNEVCDRDAPAPFHVYARLNYH